MQHELVDQDEVAEGDFPAPHLPHGEADHAGLRQRDDQGLAAVEAEQRQAVAAPGEFPFFQFGVVAARLEILVAEVLDGLEVEQAVQGPGVAGGIRRVHFPHELGAPFGGPQREHAVGEHR